MSTYRLEITYRSTEEAGVDPQVETGLSSQQLEIGAAALVRDMTGLEGKGVRKLVISVES